MSRALSIIALACNSDEIDMTLNSTKLHLLQINEFPRWTDRGTTWGSPPWLKRTFSLKLDEPLSNQHASIQGGQIHNFRDFDL